jgi:hypothetical protein
LIISNTTSIEANIFGSFGGGGKSGKLTVGKVGNGGSSGISISGKRGKLSISNPNNSDNFISTVTSKFGTVGKNNFGKLGNKIGLVLISNSGKATVNQALILCKSIIISGHFGNLIIGNFGTIISIRENSSSNASCLSFLHS